MLLCDAYGDAVPSARGRRPDPGVEQMVAHMPVPVAIEMIVEVMIHVVRQMVARAMVRAGGGPGVDQDQVGSTSACELPHRCSLTPPALGYAFREEPSLDHHQQGVRLCMS
jgi:hypothetical protein